MIQILFYIILIISFFLVGTLQFLGLSITITSYLLITLISLIMLSVFLVKKRIVINSYLVVNLCLLLWIVISGIANNTNPLLVINYFAYVIIPVSLYFLVKSISQDIFKLKYLINILIIITSFL